ncbi:hypothetical protein P692DRAFT_20837826 [Suillus brevipes Sb2]|nr:hypothetical protein P692DRAFT_20837826 [Suillus brevipes Sb2]
MTRQLTWSKGICATIMTSPVAIADAIRNQNDFPKQVKIILRQAFSMGAMRSAKLGMNCSPRIP